MVSKTVVIKNEQGLHMRPAGVLAKEAENIKVILVWYLMEKRLMPRVL